MRVTAFQRQAGREPVQVVQCTPRELDVLRLIFRGLASKEIGHHLKLREETVRTMVSRMLQSLGFSSRVQMALLCVRYPELVDCGTAMLIPHMEDCGCAYCVAARACDSGRELLRAPPYRERPAA